MSARGLWVFALAGMTMGCSGASPAKRAGPYIAFTADFEPYRTWTTFDRGTDPIPPSHRGHSFIYIDPAPLSGQTSFPVGTRIVRVEQVGDDPSAWEVHAMTKRGRGFNADGARGWEFFELSLDDGGVPSMVWRGEGPADGDGYLPPEGGDLLSCNHCHASARPNDSVLSPVLSFTGPAP